MQRLIIQYDIFTLLSDLGSTIASRLTPRYNWSNKEIVSSCSILWICCTQSTLLTPEVMINDFALSTWPEKCVHLLSYANNVTLSTPSWNCFDVYWIQFAFSSMLSVNQTIKLFWKVRWRNSSIFIIRRRAHKGSVSETRWDEILSNTLHQLELMRRKTSLSDKCSGWLNQQTEWKAV